MRYFRNHFGRCFAFLIAIQILNMSIDSPSAQMPKNIPGAENFNYIDTYVVFIAEVILKYNNAIPETKHRTQKELQMQKQFELAIQQNVVMKISPIETKSTEVALFHPDCYACRYVGEITPPPPKSPSKLV